jgi:ADP-ribose pyrophosphatase YjhB (NUDIX family)
VPAGYLEVGEPPQEAAIRELSEETGLRVNTDSLELLDTAFVRHPDGQHVLVIIYAAPRSETDGTVAPGSDAADARFWTLTELETHDEEIEPGYDSILEQAVSEVKNR